MNDQYPLSDERIDAIAEWQIDWVNDGTSEDSLRRFARAVALAAVEAERRFDAWQQNPYTKVQQKSIAEDYVPRSGAIPEDRAALVEEVKDVAREAISA